MAGFREFLTGEVLTAANVDDFLAKQVVQKYADAAARDAALGTAVAGGNALREGMVAYLDDEDEVQYFDGSVWGPVGTEPPAGIGSNVVQGVLDDVFSLSAGATFTDITDLAVTITPTSATSKVLLIAELGLMGAASPSSMQFRFTRDGVAVGVGAADGVRAQASFRNVRITAEQNYGTSMTFLDAPATSSAVAYKLQMVTEANGFLNRAETDNNLFIRGRTISTLTAIEVAG